MALYRKGIGQGLLFIGGSLAHNANCCCESSGICCTIEFDDDFSVEGGRDPTVSFTQNCTGVANSAACTTLNEDGIFHPNKSCADAVACPPLDTVPCDIGLDDYPAADECLLYCRVWTTKDLNYAQYRCGNNNNPSTNCCLLYTYTNTMINVSFYLSCNPHGGYQIADPSPSGCVYAPPLSCDFWDFANGACDNDGNDLAGGKSDCFSCQKITHTLVGKLKCGVACPDSFGISHEKITGDPFYAMDEYSEGRTAGCSDNVCNCSCGGNVPDPVALGACCIGVWDDDDGQTYTCSQTTALACQNLQCEARKLGTELNSYFEPNTSCEGGCD